MNILSKIANTKITSIAQHDPSHSPQLKSKITSYFLDVNNDDFNHDLKYLSDSVQRWRSGCMCQHIGKENRLEILTHPIWWSKTSLNREQILNIFRQQKKDSLLTRINKAKKFYKKYLSVKRHNE